MTAAAARQPLSGFRIVECTDTGPVGTILHHDARRSRRRYHQDRGARRRQRTQPGHAGRGAVVVLRRLQSQQALDRARSEIAAGQDGAGSADPQRRRARREFSARRAHPPRFQRGTAEELRPGLVTADLGFGSQGPYKDRPAFDFIAQAMSGFMSTNGRAEDPPLRSALPISDLVAGIYCALGVTAALLGRERQAGMSTSTSA